MKNHHDHCDHGHSHKQDGHVHDGEHAHATVLESKPTRAFQISIVFNLLFVIVELYSGFMSDSLSLIGDALHNFGDVFALVLSWLGYHLATSQATKKLSFGYKKFSILVSFFNAATLVLTSFYIIFAAIERFRHPELQNSVVMMVVAGIGFVINMSTAMLFHKGHQHDLNVKSAYLHLLGDALVSLGVVAAGALIYWTGGVYVDPIVSVLIAVVILAGTWGLLKESTVLLMNGVPQQISYDQVMHFLKSFENVGEVNDLKIWAISTSEFAVTMKLKNRGAVAINRSELQKKIESEFKIQNVTIQLD